MCFAQLRLGVMGLAQGKCCLSVISKYSSAVQKADIQHAELAD
jgi:hypothetical protein